MASYNYGKTQVAQMIREAYPQGSTCLDVGACDGVWYHLLGDHLKMDAVEAFEPNITAHGLRGLYNEVFAMDAVELGYTYYDLVIFGDVLEHMTIENAQECLEYARNHSKDALVALPFHYPQGAIYGNPYEEHLQDDLDENIIAERYPMLEPLLIVPNIYGYYHIAGGPINGR